MLDIAYHAAPVVPAQGAFRRRRMQLFTGIQSWVVRRYLLHGLILAVSAGVTAAVAIA